MSFYLFKLEIDDEDTPREWATNATLMCGEIGGWITKKGDVILEESLGEMCQRMY